MEHVRPLNLTEVSLAAISFISLGWYYSYIPKIQPPVSNPVVRLVEYLDGILWWEGYLIAVGILVAIYSYRSQNLISAWLLTFAWGAAIGVNLGGIGITGSLPGLGFRIFWGAIIGLISAILLGSVAYAIAVVIRTSLRENQSAHG